MQTLLQTDDDKCNNDSSVKTMLQSLPVNRVANKSSTTRFASQHISTKPGSSVNETHRQSWSVIVLVQPNVRYQQLFNFQPEPSQLVAETSYNACAISSLRSDIKLPLHMWYSSSSLLSKAHDFKPVSLQT